MNTPSRSLLLLALLLASTALPCRSQEGRELYLMHCAQCHGKNLQGGNAQSMVDGVWQYGAGRGYISRNIERGIPHLGMPSFGDSLSSKQIRAVTDYLLEAEKSAGAVKPPPPDSLETYHYDIDVKVWVSDLSTPWAIDFLDTGTALITERPGALRVVRNGALLPDPVADTPQVLAEGQGGLLDVAVDPDYPESPWIYLAYSHALPKQPDQRRPGAMTRIVRGQLRDHRWTDQQVLYEAPHDTYRTTRHHYGSRIVFDHSGMLYFCIGDRGGREQAQDLARPNGKVHRIHRDGRVPADNPFSGRDDALPTIFTYGHRNPQGMAVHPQTGEVWITEHGPMGGDELNRLVAGRNYGWPVITYGLNYSGTPISTLTHKEGMTQPNLYWRPSIAVCGLDFYEGEPFQAWQNALLAGALKYEEVRLLQVEDERVLHQEVILKNAGRVRAVSHGPDGAIYVVLNRPDLVLRLTPADE